MKKWGVWLLMALLLCSRTALAAKARDIQTEADSQYHAAHLARHIGMQDLSCTGNYVKLRSKANGTTVVGHLEQADADISRYADMLLEDTSEFVSFAEYRRRTAL